MQNKDVAKSLSLIHGSPVADEPGVGSLTIPSYLREVVDRFADREALVMHASDGASRRVIRWSYQTLYEQSLAVARALVSHGVDTGARVGILMTNRPEFLSSLFGISMAGAVPVALSTFSTASELEQLLAMSEAEILLFERAVLTKDFASILIAINPALAGSDADVNGTGRLPALRRAVKLDPVTAVEGVSAEGEAFQSWANFLSAARSISEAEIQARIERILPGDPGGLFFSSGTTSLPKGILHSQQAFALQWWRYPSLMRVNESVRTWTGNGFFWSGNITMTIGLAFSTGGATVLQPYFEAEEALRLFDEEKVSYISGRPHQWARLQEAPNWNDVDLSSLAYITRAEQLRVHPTVNSDWEVPMGYGNTETMSINTSNIYNLASEDSPNSFGTVCPGNILKIIDPLSGEILPRGERGEVCIKGPTLMLGYLGKSPEDTFDRDGFFHTGDGGYVDEFGCLFFEGRLNEIIKTGGANVSPLEIDSTLALYPGIRRAVTVGMPDELLDERVVTCVVAHDNANLEIADIMRFLKDRLASFKVPKQIFIVDDGDIEVTGSGKAKVDQLRAVVQKRLEESVL